MALVDLLICQAQGIDALEVSKTSGEACEAHSECEEDTAIVVGLHKRYIQVRQESEQSLALSTARASLQRHSRKLTRIAEAW